MGEKGELVGKSICLWRGSKRGRAGPGLELRRKQSEVQVWAVKVCVGCVQLSPGELPRDWMYTNLEGERFDWRHIGLGVANIMETAGEMRLFIEDTWEQAEAEP